MPNDIREGVTNLGGVKVLFKLTLVLVRNRLSLLNVVNDSSCFQLPTFPFTQIFVSVSRKNKELLITSIFQQKSHGDYGGCESCRRHQGCEAWHPHLHLVQGGGAVQGRQQGQVCGAHFYLFFSSLSLLTNFDPDS